MAVVSRTIHPCQAVALLALLFVAASILISGIAVLQSTESEDLFKGSHWNHPGETIEAQELLTAKYVRVESHTIRTSGGEVVSGWLWVDFHDRVDILVEDQDGRFLLYKQTNYALPAQSLAVLSVHLGQHEDPLKAAKNELSREMGRRCTHWVHMGTYRTDANRGAGFVTTYLARWTGPLDQSQRQSTDDLEAKSLVRMTRREVREALLSGSVLEVKWAAVISLGLLHLEQLDVSSRLGSRKSGKDKPMSVRGASKKGKSQTNGKLEISDNIVFLDDGAQLSS